MEQDLVQRQYETKLDLEQKIRDAETSPHPGLLAIVLRNKIVVLRAYGLRRTPSSA